MTTNVFSIKPAHDRARISLRGDMSVSFDDAVTNTFTVAFLTSTSDVFTLNSTKYHFKDTEGATVQGLVFGGRPGLFLEMMFDPAAGTWYIVANNIVSGTSGGGSSSTDTSEHPLAFLALPSLTPIDYNIGKNFRGKLTANAKLANPTGIKPGDRIRVVIQQDAVGGHTLAFDGAYGFPDAQQPILSTRPGAVDVYEGYLTGDWTLQGDVRKNYSIIAPLAYGTQFSYTMQAAYTSAESNPIDGQTVQVIRDGSRLECNGTIGATAKAFNLRVRGVQKPDGTYPTLRLDKTDRPAYGKALINIENGTNVVIEDLIVAGASAYDDGNGTGILINGGVDYVLIKNVHLLDNEDGVRSSVSDHPKYDLLNVLLTGNGWAANPQHSGFSHSIYAGEGPIWRCRSSTFYSPVAGHNIKTRALQTVLNQVYVKRSNQARELDCPDQGLVHATDCVFWKDSDAVQNNLIGIGHELIHGAGRAQEYFFINCYFHNDVDPGREVTFVENMAGGDVNLNTVVVHFIDCEFGGRILLKRPEYITSLFKGPCTVTLTGGPVGPRVPVGDPRMLFDMNSRDPNRQTNPTNATLTPFSELPPMTVTEPTPPYPIFVDVPDVPELPVFGIDHVATPDTTLPVVALGSTATTVTVSGTSVTLTATASDNVGISKVEFYKNGVLLGTDTTLPYAVIETYTYVDNGNISYNVIAYDAATNHTTSNSVVVTVNIPAPHIKPTDRLDATTQAEYDAAVSTATLGTKRVAAATALVTAMGTTTRLNVYKDGNLIIPVNLVGGCTMTNDGYDVYVKPSGNVASSDAIAGDLSTGIWWFELQGGNAFSRVITGTVGVVGSGSELELAANPAPGQGFISLPKFVMPRTLDGLS